MSKIYNSIVELIGNTPIVKLNHFAPENGADIYVKIEAFNPGSSVKDRIALAMIEDAEKTGQLKPGDTIIEPTSGNTGIGLSMVGAAKGYNVIIVMPDTMSIERRKLIQAFGTKLILTPGSAGIKGSIEKATKLAQKNGYFLPLQFENHANPQIHEETTGKEIIEAFGEDAPDAFVAGVGTGGTISGVGHVLKKAYPEIKVIAVEPAESAVLSGQNSGPHKIQGIGTGFVPKTLDTDVYDEVIAIKSDDALDIGRTFGQKEGILVGISSGAALKAAYDLAIKLGNGKKVVVLLPDNGERYLSTSLYQFED